MEHELFVEIQNIKSLIMESHDILMKEIKQIKDSKKVTIRENEDGRE